MISVFFVWALSSCSTEVGLIGYVEKNQDTSEVVVDSADTNEPADSGEVLPNSGITGYTNYKLRQVACPACVGESQEITVTFTGQFHQPSTDGHTEWIPSPGTCVDNLYTVSPSTVPMSVGSSFTVSSPGHSFVVPQTGNGTYQTTQIWESQYQRDSVYTVQTDEGSFDLVSSHGFDFIEPYTLLWVDPSYAYDAAIYRNSATTFSWSPTNTDSIFMITVAV